MALEDIEKLKEKVAKDPKSKLFVPLADEYRKTGMLDEAMSVLLNGLNNQPEYMSARVSLGKVYLEKNMIAEAKEEFEKVITTIPDNLFAHKKLAEIYKDMGDKEKAIGEYKTVLKLNSLDEDAVSKLQELQRTPGFKDVVTPSIPHEESPVEETAIAESLPEAEKVVDMPAEEKPPQSPVEDDFEKFKRSITERDEGTEEVSAEEVISEEEIEDIGDIEKVKEEVSAYVDIFSETKIASPPPIEAIQEDKPVTDKPVEKKNHTIVLKDAELLISKGDYFKAMKLYRGILSAEPENRLVLQKVEELKLLLKMLGKDQEAVQEAVIEKLEAFGEGLKKRKDEFLRNT